MKAPPFDDTTPWLSPPCRVLRMLPDGDEKVCEKDQRGLTGLSAAYAAASQCGVQPVEQESIHALLVM